MVEFRLFVHFFQIQATHQYVLYNLIPFHKKMVQLSFIFSGRKILKKSRKRDQSKKTQQVQVLHKSQVNPPPVRGQQELIPKCLNGLDHKSLHFVQYK